MRCYKPVTSKGAQTNEDATVRRRKGSRWETSARERCAILCAMCEVSDQKGVERDLPPRQNHSTSYRRGVSEKTEDAKGVRARC